METTYNTLVAKITKRARELGNLKMDELRLSHPDVEGVNIHGNPISPIYEARQILKGKERGDIIEEILDDEFCLEFDIQFEE